MTPLTVATKYSHAMPEAPLEDSGSGLAPAGEGWFVVNVRDAEWLTSEPAPTDGRRSSGAECAFESRKFSFGQLGIRIDDIPLDRLASGLVVATVIDCNPTAFEFVRARELGPGHPCRHAWGSNFH